VLQWGDISLYPLHFGGALGVKVILFWAIVNVAALE
jgi:hypothetical protein